LPTGLTAAANGVGSIIISGNPLVPAGIYPIGLKVVDPHNLESTATVTITVTKESAETTFTGDMLVVTAGPSINTATVRLAAHLTQQSDGYPGDISLARVTFEVFSSSNMGSTPDYLKTGVPVDSNGDALTFLSGVPADSYVVKVKIDSNNGYWTATPVGIGVINVVIGSDEQRTIGGGWVADGIGHANFGFNVRNDKGNPKGSSIFVFRATDGFEYVVKSNSWAGGFLNFAAQPGTTILNRSSFKGKCQVQKIDPATGLVIATLGNYTFTVDAVDGDLLTPRQADAYAITILDNNGVIWRRVGTNTSPLSLGGGNVAVKTK